MSGLGQVPQNDLNKALGESYNMLRFFTAISHPNQLNHQRLLLFPFIVLSQQVIVQNDRFMKGFHQKDMQQIYALLVTSIASALKVPLLVMMMMDSGS